MLACSLALVFLAGLGAPLAAQDFVPGDVILAAAQDEPSGPRGTVLMLGPDGGVREKLPLPLLDFGPHQPHSPTALVYAPDQGLLVFTTAGRFGQYGELFAADRRAPHALHSLGAIHDFGMSLVSAVDRDGRGRLYIANGDFQATSCCPYTQALRVFSPGLELLDTFELEVGEDGPIGVGRLAVRPDGRELVYQSGAAEVRRYDLQARAALPSLVLPGPVGDLAWLGSGDEFLVATYDESLGADEGSRVRHLDTSGNTLATYEFPDETAWCLALDASGRSFVLVTRRAFPHPARPDLGVPYGMVLRRIDLATGATLLHRRLPANQIYDLTVVEREKLRQR